MELTGKKEELVELYREFLLKYNKKVNLVSRKITKDKLDELISESVELNRYISGKTIIDAGSGNGILGFVLAILNSDKKIYMIETIKKKCVFLKEAKKELKLKNIEIENRALQEFCFPKKREQNSLISRGFPRTEDFWIYLKKKEVKEVVLISSVKKIGGLENKIKNVILKTYNLPNRDYIKILKMENVSRETI